MGAALTKLNQNDDGTQPESFQRRVFYMSLRWKRKSPEKGKYSSTENVLIDKFAEIYYEYHMVSIYAM